MARRNEEKYPKTIRKRRFSHRHKTRLHTYFSANNKFVSMKVEEAAHAGAFNWTHPNMEPLKKCLGKMKE